MIIGKEKHLCGKNCCTLQVSLNLTHRKFAFNLFEPRDSYKKNSYKKTQFSPYFFKKIDKHEVLQETDYAYVQCYDGTINFFQTDTRIY